ncbi:MAG TPA: universal stress protein [Hyphomonadaceae bacterium]|nr:universal stress protein [Hyphomonadaceae bacterium]
MTYRNILVTVDPFGASRLRVAAAVNIARRFNASLTGVFLQAEAIPPFIAGDAFSAVTAVEAFMDDRKAVIAEAVVPARTLFETAAKNAGIPFTWHEINGDDSDTLAACARRHDLTILPPTIPITGFNHTLDAAQVAMAAGGPVLILPELGYTPNFGANVLVAWKETREAARAVRDAWPFLAAAGQVTFLTVGSDAEPAFDAIQQSNLNAHNCSHAKLVVDTNDGRDVSDAIRLRTGMVGADMLVLGLYGHSRLHELLLGGVSRGLMKDVPMPILVSH